MQIIIQNPQPKKSFSSLYLLLILSFFMTQCGKSPKQASTATHNPEGGFILALPSELKKHQSGKNITAQLIIDGGTPIDMTIDLETDQVTASTGSLTPGLHRFVIQYYLDGALITTATSQAEIIAGQDTRIVFTPDLNIHVAPMVLATQPAENATAVAANSSISATFSQPMNTSSITSLNFTLSGLAGSVAGSVSYTESPPSFEARFTPTQSLALAANYTASLNTGISGILGEPLATTENWTFTTADGTWGNVEGVDFDSVADPINNADSAQISVNAKGNGIAVWRQFNGIRTDIWANRYVKEIGWGTPELIETRDVGSAASPQVTIDPDGNAIAVWKQFDGTRTNIWANRFDTNTTSWGTATLIETDNSDDADSPQVAINGNGNAIAVWQQDDGSFDNIMSNHYNANLGTWGTALEIETGLGLAQTPQIALTSNGNAVAIWRQHDGTRFSIFANRFDFATISWGIAEAIESDNAGDASIPQIAMNPSGRAIAVWLQNDGSAINAVSNRFVPETGWASLPIIIDTETPQAFTPQIALDTQGNAFAVWRQSNGSGLHIFSNRFDNSTGLWGTPIPLEAEIASNVGFPQIIFDPPNGNAIALWAQLTTGDSVDNIWAKRYTQNAGWETAEKTEIEDLGSAGFPKIALDASGNAIAVWAQGNGTTINIKSNRFQ